MTHISDSGIQFCTLADIRAAIAKQSVEHRCEQSYRRGYCDGFAAAIECVYSVTKRKRGYDAAWDFHDDTLLEWYKDSVRNEGMKLPPRFSLWRHNSRGTTHPDNGKWQRKRHEVLDRDNWACRYCGRPAQHVDHVMPKSRGGENSVNNLVASCARCNCSKGARTPEEAGIVLMPLLSHSV